MPFAESYSQIFSFVHGIWDLLGSQQLGSPTSFFPSIKIIGRNNSGNITAINRVDKLKFLKILINPRKF